MRCSLEYERRYRAWERFFASGEIDGEVVRPEVAQSWRRCRDLGLDPCAPKRPVHWSADELTSKLRTKGAYIEAALPTTGFLRTAVRGTGFILVLTDEDGIVLDSFGDAEILARANENNYVPGCCRAEDVVGTNAIALAMVERRPVQLTGPEHYNVRHHSWTCASSPVFSPNGAFLGTVTLSGESTDAHRHTLGMVIAASEAIQHRLREQTIEAEKSHSEKLTRSLLKSITDAIVTIDTSGKIVYVNKVAEALLGRGEQQLSGQDLATIFTGTDIAGVVAGRSSTSPFEIAYDFRGSRKYFIVKPMVMHDEAGMMGAILALSPRREFLRNVRSLSESSAPYTFADIVGRHSSIRRAVELADMVAKTDSRVLIIGETGTGKELLVQGIHNASGRACGPFVAINCAAIPHELIEAELLGYKDGAFTGARRGGQVGKFELADGGTLFLDEISQMPLGMQAKLLRVLQDGMVTRLGDTKPVKVDVRVIAATNEDLFEKSHNKAFRLDLYFRLSVVEIFLPPLRERGEDIELLAETLLQRLCQRLGRPSLSLSKAAIECLQGYSWLGNVRELENILEMAVIVCDGTSIAEEHLSSRVRRRPCAEPRLDSASDGSAPLPGARRSGDGRDSQMVSPIKDLEANAIRSALVEYNCNIAQVSRVLGISRSKVYRRMREIGVSRQVRLD